jgi:hypothetical protein
MIPAEISACCADNEYHYVVSLQTCIHYSLFVMPNITYALPRFPREAIRYDIYSPLYYSFEHYRL